MVIVTPRNKGNRKKTGQQNTNRLTKADQKLTIQLLNELLDRYSLKIGLKFSADLRFAVFFFFFFKFANPINLLQKSAIRLKPIYPHLIEELLKLLKRLATYDFG